MWICTFKTINNTTHNSIWTYTFAILPQQIHTDPVRHLVKSNERQSCWSCIFLYCSCNDSVTQVYVCGTEKSFVGQSWLHALVMDFPFTNFQNVKCHFFHLLTMLLCQHFGSGWAGSVNVFFLIALVLLYSTNLLE